MFVFGGKSKLGRVGNILWRLDLVLREWTQLPGPGGVSTVGASAASGGSSFVSIGNTPGQLPQLSGPTPNAAAKRKSPASTNYIATGATIAATPTGLSGAQLESPHVRAFAAAVAVANRWLIFGGESNTGAGRQIGTETLEFNFKLERWRVISTLTVPKPLIGTAAAAVVSEVTHTIVLVGGADLSSLARSTTISIELLKHIATHAKLEDIALPVPIRDILCSLRHLVLDGAPRSVVRDLKRMVSAMVKRQDASDRAVAEFASVSHIANQRATEASAALSSTMAALAHAERREEQLQIELASIEAAKAAVAGRELALLRNIETLKSKSLLVRRRGQARIERVNAALKSKDAELTRVRKETKAREIALLCEAETLKDQLAGARREAQQLSAECEEASRKATDLSSELESRYADSLVRAREAKSIAEQLQLERSELARQLEKRCAMQERLENEASERRRENDRLEVLLAEKDAEMRKASAINSTETQRLLDERRDCLQRSEALQRECDCQTKSRENAERAAARRAAEVTKLSEQLKSTKQVLEGTMAELDLVRRQAGTTAAELGKRTHALSKAAAELEDVSLLNEDLSNQLREMGKRMSEKVQRIETQRAELELHVNSKQQLLGGMQRLVELMELQKQIVEQQAQQTLSRLRDVVTEAKRNLEQATVASPDFVGSSDSNCSKLFPNTCFQQDSEGPRVD